MRIINLKNRRFQDPSEKSELAALHFAHFYRFRLRVSFYRDIPAIFPDNVSKSETPMRGSRIPEGKGIFEAYRYVGQVRDVTATGDTHTYTWYLIYACIFATALLHVNVAPSHPRFFPASGPCRFFGSYCVSARGAWEAASAEQD